MTRVLHPFQSTFLEQSDDGLNILWAPTGAGKTFALMKDAESSAQRVVLYLTATPELVDQVAEEIRIHQEQRTAGVTRIARGKEYGSIRQSLEKNPKWLVATPGRLDAILDEGEQLDAVDYCIIDEADHLIHPDRSAVIESLVARMPNCKRFTAASASFRKKHLETLEQLTKHKANVVRTEATEQKVDLISMIPADDKTHKLRQLVQLLPMLEGKRGMIFCPTQSAADQAAAKLNFHKIPTVALTGGKNVAARRKVLSQFSSGEISWLVTTDIASRGIDIEGVDVVIHSSAPINVIEFGHRNGRAGRRDETVTVYAQCTAQEWNKMAGLASKTKTNVKKWLPEALEGTYKGPKKIKSSGKAASKKKRKPAAAAKGKRK